MSRDRLRNITKGGLTCIFNYCNYLCMQEYYDLSAGEIYTDCRCSAEELGKVDKSRPTIDDTCYKPNSSDCSWFDRCFSHRYPNCTESDGIQLTKPLAVEFEQRFCSLAEQRQPNYLSDLARQWLSQVNKCLIDKLSPWIRPWQNEKCDNIESSVFDSFRSCYLKPDLNLLTNICQLDCKSWWLIFRDLKNFFDLGNHKWNRVLNQYFKFGVKGLRICFFF